MTAGSRYRHSPVNILMEIPLLRAFSISYKVIARPLLLIFLLTAPVSGGSRVIIDPMDDWWVLATPTAPHNNVHTLEDNANRIRYDLPRQGWVALVKEGAGLLDASTGDAISFRARGSGKNNNLQIQLRDKDGSLSVRSFKGITSEENWYSYTVPFAFLDAGEDDPLNRSSVSFLGFAVTPSEGGAGSVTIDSIESLHLRTDAVYTISTFDQGYPPMEGSWSDEGASVESLYDPDNALSGLYTLKLEYDLSGSKGGYYWKLSSDHPGVKGYEKLRAVIRSTAPGKSFKFELKDSGGDTLGSFEVPPTVDTEWNDIEIDLGSVGFGIDSNDKPDVQELTLVIVDGDHEAAGLLYLDRVEFTSGNAQDMREDIVYDSMELPWQISGWKNYGRDANLGITSSRLESVPGAVGGRAIKLEYEFRREEPEEDDWVVMERDWGLNLATATHLGFSYAGTGDSNNLEVKIQDKNGTIYWRKFFSVTDTGGKWRDKKIPLSVFALFEKGDQGEVDLDLTKLNKFDFAVSGNEGSTGDIYIRDLGLYFKSDFKRERTGRLIENIEVTNNPFSPSGDGLKDTTEFLFSLSGEASVKLEIFSVNGSRVYEKDLGNLSSGLTHTHKWDGRDSSGSRVSNGMYFYRLRASGSGGSESIKNLIGVIR